MIFIDSCKYKQLTPHERIIIAIMYNEEGRTANEIAQVIERHHSTIYREIERNLNGFGRYDPSFAQELSDGRKRAKKNRSKFTIETKETIEEKMELGWSPEIICNWNRVIQENKDFVSTKTIYRYIHAGLVSSPKYLRKKGKKYKRAADVNRMKGGKSIHSREQIINNRGRIGDWEVDTVVGKKGTKAVILTLVDRKTRFLLSKICSNRKAETISSGIVELLENQPVCSITADNGPEFSDFQYVEKKLGINVYFADPYCSWQRGTNENTNGLIREYVPKGTDIGKVDRDYFKRCIDLINGRPRKVLGYYMPKE
ncbi:IS30 family transposase, partial [Enterococcus sp. C76]|uniref:IS30 family transposase n=1 Tax=Enterococcus sp. C76 TaxID=3231334 RepID=UPI0034A066DF